MYGDDFVRDNLLLWLRLCNISLQLTVPLLLNAEVSLFLCFVGVGASTTEQQCRFLGEHTSN